MLPVAPGTPIACSCNEPAGRQGLDGSYSSGGVPALGSRLSRAVCRFEGVLDGAVSMLDRGSSLWMSAWMRVGSNSFRSVCFGSGSGAFFGSGFGFGFATFFGSGFAAGFGAGPAYPQPSASQCGPASAFAASAGFGGVAGAGGGGGTTETVAGGGGAEPSFSPGFSGGFWLASFLALAAASGATTAAGGVGGRPALPSVLPAWRSL